MGRIGMMGREECFGIESFGAEGRGSTYTSAGGRL